MEKIVWGWGQEANIAQGEAECFISLETAIFSVMHESMQYFN